MLLRNPRRELEMSGPVRVSKLLETLGINPETVLVIRNDTLVTHDERIGSRGDRCVTLCDGRVVDDVRARRVQSARGPAMPANRPV